MADVDAGHGRTVDCDAASLASGSRRPGRGGMLDCRRVDDLKLRITEDGTELPLAEGRSALVRDHAGLHVVADGPDALMRLRIDRRGIWLDVPDGATGIHVNGRSVQRLAMLRPGDAVYLEGSELVLVGGRRIAVPDDALLAAPAGEGDPRAVVRGIGGKHHGRCVTLERPRLVGSAADADIRIDDPAFPERHAQLSQIGGRLVLRDLGTGEGTQVNGRPVDDAILEAADQLVFDGRHRFVVEAPLGGDSTLPVFEAAADASADGTRTRSWRRWPWLLLAALLVAASLAALLLFGAAR